MKRLTLESAPATLDTTIALPTSKSLSNRGLILQALSGNRIALHELSEAADTTLLQQLLADDPAYLDCQNAGTVLRFLTAYAALKPGERYLTGTDRMKARPIAPLVSALQQLGAVIAYTGQTGYPPIQVTGGHLEGGVVNMDATVSSQFVTALLLIAPFTTKGVHLSFDGIPVSRPYFAMTIKLLQHFNVRVEQKSNEVAVWPKAQLPEKSLTIEPDWSAASYWIGMGALLPGSQLFFPQMAKRSWQGDSAMLDLTKGFGVQPQFSKAGLQVTTTDESPDHFEGFLTDHPDLVPTLVALCVGAQVPFQMLGLAHLRDKESDRLTALATEMSKTGANLQTRKDGISCSGYQSQPEAFEIDTYQDHRMAMAGGILATAYPGLSIADPDVVVKSYPLFWQQLAEAGFSMHQTQDHGK